jgi:hypothetical protein
MKLRSFMPNVPAILAVAAAVIISACTPQGNGTIVFTANGEDFVRQGFIDKNGWDISFDKVLVNIANPEAYNADGLKSVLNGSFFVDLAAGDAEAEPVVVGKTEKASRGQLPVSQIRHSPRCIRRVQGFIQLS